MSSRPNPKQFLRAQLRRLGFDIVRFRPRPKYPGDDDRFEYQRRFNRFDIPSGSVVLDIGAGHYPFPLATILSDLYIADSPHRTEEAVRDHRPYLVLDIHHLPFRDKSIDFIYCSHVLEHVGDPLQACSELMRVGRRGYVETPAFASDLLFSWAEKVNHKWHIVAISNTLCFFEYTERQRGGIQSVVWDDWILGPAYHPLQDVFYGNLDLFNVMFLWNDRFECLVWELDSSRGRVRTEKVE